MDFYIAAAHVLAANAVALVAVLASGVGGRSMAHDVFISHARTDKWVAKQVIAALAAEHISCWTAPRDALAALDKAIPEARVLILLLSTASNSSPQVERELALAAALEA